MNHHTLEGGGQLPHEALESPKSKSRFSRFIASMVAAVLSLAGLVAVAPGAYAAPAGITISTLHNGSPVSDGAVVEAGDIFTLRVLYDNNLESQTIVVGPPEGLTFDESSLDVSGNDAIESINLVDGNIHLNFIDPAEWDVNQGVWDLDFTIQEVELPESRTIEWTVDGEPSSIDVIVINESAQEENVSNQLAKSMQELNLDRYLSVNQGTVELDEAVLDETFEYTLTINSDRDTDRSGFTIEDEISEYLAYHEESFEATITTWDEIGWNSTTEPFEFTPEVSGNSFTYSGDIPNPSELTVTYTASIPEGQLEALTAALQTEFDALGGPGEYTVGLNNTVNFGDGSTDEANVNITGTRTEDDGPHEVTNFLDKSAGNTNLDGFVSFNESGQVVLNEDITNHDILYTLTVNTASGEDRNGFTFVDQLSPYLEYNQDSFEAEMTTWDEGGWNSETNAYEFTPEFSDDGFTFTGDIEGPSELTVTYTASVASDQLDALRDALQAAFDALGVDSGDYRVSLDNTITFGGNEEREANVSVGNNRADGEGPENVSDRLAKGVGDVDLSQFVEVYEGEVSIDEEILDQRIRYALVVNTDRETQRPAYTIHDEISEFLIYDQDSFEAEITTWDDNGWNQATNPFDYDIAFENNNFTITGDIVGPSELTIRYDAYVAEDQLEALTAALQDRFDELEAGWGSFSMELPNTATFGGDTEREDSVTIGGNLPEPPVPSVEDAFDKNSNIESINITPDEDGTLEPPLDVTYTFAVDLTQWDGNAADGYLNHDDFTLERNVVISDTLPEQASWNADADEFISGMDLEEATDFDGDADAFADDEYIGQYAVVGQNLYINVGTDHETNGEIAVKALITTVAGLTGTDEGGIERFELDNDAEFIYSDDKEPYSSSTTITLHDRGDGIADESKFSKTALNNDEPISVSPGESATVEYRFAVNQDPSEAVDMTESYIVDYRDPHIFDFSDLDQAVESIRGTLQDDVALDESHFDLSVNEDGNLVIAINAAGEALIEEQGADPTASFVLDLTLNTRPVTGKQTLSIENNATLYGSRDEALFVSGTTSQATSYGNEAEVRKSIRDTPNEAWTQNLRAEVDEDGNLVRDHFVYNLAFIPHGSYEGVPVSAVLDELPDEVEFVGFLTDENVDTHDNPVDGPIDIGGNLEAVYEDGVVTVQQQEGTLLEQEPNISANVLVRVVDFEDNVPVVNVFGNSASTFTPSEGYPLSIAKVDSEDDEVVINDPDARFNVLDEDDNVVIEDAFVENGNLRVLDDQGETSALVVEDPGTYYVEEIVAPTGYDRATDPIQVTVNPDGTSDQVTFYNDPTPTYAIGDYVWIDENRDGMQGDDEAPLGGVTVVLYDAEGDELDRTTTDENGRYLFDNLPSGEYQVGFELDADQAELYEFTAYTEGDAAEDSNAGDQGRSEVFELGPNSPLTSGEDYEHFEVNASEGIDPNWDAGVVRIEYAIGDYVWIDANRDGVQDEDEEPLEGVTVVLYDGDDNELDRTTTDENGRYLFDNLTSGDYQVGFELTEEQQRLYNFTTYNAGDDERWDSNAGNDNRSEIFRLDRDNASLISDNDYEHGTVTASEGIDPTWDAGVVTKTYAIGDFVWVDSDADGQQGEDEDPLPGVTVELYTVDEHGHRSEEPVETTTTDDHGKYLFDNLEEGDYQVRYILTEEQARKYNFTEYTEGDTTTDSDAGEDGYSDIISLNVDNESLDPDYQDQDFTATEGVDPTWDAGVTPKPYAIGDFVWIDENRDGIQDDHEPSLEGVTVVLYDGEGNELDRTVTDEHGRYLFDYLNEGDYQVGFELTEAQQELYEFTEYTVAEDAQVDSNAGEDGRSAVFTLGPESTLVDNADYEHGTFGARLGIDPTWDAGVVRLEYAVGDYVWIDKNHNGIQDEDEEPLEGVTVVLYDGDGNELDRTVTDENGRYLFDNLPRGEYQVGFELTEAQAAKYQFTKYTAGDDTAVDSNAGEQARSAVFTLGPENEFLVSNEEYDHGTVTASEGIDPTWDAGVVLLPEPETPVDPTGPTGEPTEAPSDHTDPEDPAGPGPDTSDDNDGELPLTGAGLALILTAAGLLLLLAGGTLYARHRKGTES